jgi:hypothetical protein
MLRAHAADARYWRPQTTGSTRRSNSRPADAIRSKIHTAHRVVEEGAEQERPRSAAAVSYMGNAAILAAMRQDKVLWARVHSPSPAAIPEEKSKRSHSNAASRRPLLSSSARSHEHALPCASLSLSPGVDVSVFSSPPPSLPNDDQQSRAPLLSPSPSARDQLQSPSSGPAVKTFPPTSDPRAYLPSHGALTQFLSLERKQPQRRQQHEQGSALPQQQATNPHSPLKPTADNQAQTPKLASRTPASSVSKQQSPSQSAQCLPATSLETCRVSGTSSPGAVSTGLQRLMLE